MLNQIIIKNYKCFEDFAFSFDADGHAMLLLGANGSGKTSFADVLEIFQKIGRGDGRVERLIAPAQRWDASKPVELRISVTLGETQYSYGFSLENPSGSQEFCTLSEELSCGNKSVYRREGTAISFDPTNGDKSFTYDRHVLFLPTFADSNNHIQHQIDAFRTWLANILILSPYPKMFKGEFGAPVRWPSRDCADCASWLNHLLTTSPKSYSEIEKYLQGIWSDFHTVSNEQVGSLNKQLKLEFRDKASLHKTKYAPALNSLSDGEKCLFLSAVVIAAHEVAPSTLCFWDEPDSFLSLAETAQFIQTMRGVFSGEGQLMVTSHNPEVINAFTESTIWMIDRENHLSPAKSLRRISDMRGSDILPKKASLIHALAAGEIRL